MMFKEGLYDLSVGRPWWGLAEALRFRVERKPAGDGFHKTLVLQQRIGPGAEDWADVPIWDEGGAA